jgi:hypothetical protein
VSRRSEPAAHFIDLLLLCADDGGGQRTHACVLSILKLDLRHIDGALMMRNHHEHEVVICIARHFHIHHGFVHRHHGAYEALVGVGMRHGMHHRMHPIAVVRIYRRSVRGARDGVGEQAQHETCCQSEAKAH